MMLLYDTEGNVAGMQSVVPQEELQFTCDGTVNDFYVLDVINGMNVSSANTIVVQWNSNLLRTKNSG